MNILKKNKFASVLLVSIIFSSNTFAAKFCILGVNDIVLKTNQIEVSVYDPVTFNSRDKLTIAYQDSQVGQILEKLAQSRNLEQPVKIYILEEFDGDDAISCSDGITDYIGSVHNI
jgi:membrane-anchored protein YejM (alkaline phosphatase superfamily)